MLDGCSKFLLVAVSALCMSSATAATIVTQTYTGTLPASISGTLATQGTALEETFSLPTSGTFTAFTSSYANGGFEPNLALYNSAGYYLASQSPAGTSPVAVADPSTKQALDSYLQVTNLGAGTYILTLTDWELNQSTTATNLSDGFTVNYGNGTTFVDQTGSMRTGNYVLNFSSASVSAVPEPSTFGLGCVLFAGMLCEIRRRRKSSAR